MFRDASDEERAEGELPSAMAAITAAEPGETGRGSQISQTAHRGRLRAAQSALDTVKVLVEMIQKEAAASPTSSSKERGIATCRRI